MVISSLIFQANLFLPDSPSQLNQILFVPEFINLIKEISLCTVLILTDNGVFCIMKKRVGL